MGNGCPVFWFSPASPCRTRLRTHAVLVFQEGTVERPPARFADADKKACFVLKGATNGKQAGIGSRLRQYYLSMSLSVAPSDYCKDTTFFPHSFTPR